MDKIEYTVPDDVRKQSVEQLQVKPEIIEWLKKHNYKTVEEIIRDQKILPQKIIVPIKGKIIFNVDL